MNRLRVLVSRARRPENVAVELALLLVVAGLLGISLAWRGAARVLDVSQQISFLVSGGMGGLALVGLGLAVFDIQTGRRARALERHEINELTIKAASQLDHREDS